MRCPKPLLLAAVVLSTLIGCRSKAEREWTPTDHDRLDESTPSSSARPAPPHAPNAAAPDAVDTLWNSRCASCHGAQGKGDGTAGRSLHVPDLTDQSWQERTSDAQIATVIQHGRGRMPQFPFPTEMTQALVSRVRALR